MKSVSDNNDEQHFNDVTNFKGEVTEEVYKKCTECSKARQWSEDSRSICDDHFLDRFGDLLTKEEWAGIQTRRGADFVDRWQRYIFQDPPPPEMEW